MWHEWRDGGFSIFTGENDVKLRHIEQQGRAAAVVSDNEPPFRGIEVSGRRRSFAIPSLRVRHSLASPRVTLANDAGRSTCRVQLAGMVVIRLVPGRLRTWDFADDDALSGNLPE